MIELIRTNAENKDFIELVGHLDAELAIRDGEEHVFYAQFNKIAKLPNVVVAYKNEMHVGCGAIREHAADVMEIKRMYVTPDSRDKGVATTVLLELEKWAAELGCSRCILETGFKQPEAIRLYEKNGYERIPNYGQYAEVANSICFGKDIK